MYQSKSKKTRKLFNKKLFSFYSNIKNIHNKLKFCLYEQLNIDLQFCQKYDVIATNGS